MSKTVKKKKCGSRRGFFRLSFAAGLGFLLARVGWKAREPEPAAPVERILKAGKVIVLSECTACTGCVPSCPVNAIAAMPGRIAVSDETCVSCGYCVAACPVNALRLSRECGRA